MLRNFAGRHAHRHRPQPRRQRRFRLRGLPPRREALVLETRATPGGGRLQFLRGQVRYHAESSEYQLLPLAGQGSHMLSSFAKANCLVELPPQQHHLRQGERVSVLLLGPGVNP